ncbi:MAG TPA: response regulator, partial [Desulfuromonadaceae bacterium]
MARPKILLVDDNRLFLEMEREFLQPCAVMVYTAGNGREALDVVRAVRPDLIFMDLHMPEMDGDACCAALKADPDLKSVPVVMVVTTNNGDDLARCRRVGCDHVIAKPVDREAFLAAGHQFLPGISRTETRVPCLTLVVFRLGRETLYGTSANMSGHGMFIAYDGAVEVNDLVRLSFLVPGSGGEVVEAAGRVAWVNAGSLLPKSALPKGFGVEFSEVNPEGARAIAEFISRAGMGGGEVHVEGAYVGEAFF